MILEGPKTIEDYEKVKETILELMGNPYCDQFIHLSLTKKLTKCEAKIKELNNGKS